MVKRFQYTVTYWDTSALCSFMTISEKQEGNCSYRMGMCSKKNKKNKNTMFDIDYIAYEPILALCTYKLSATNINPIFSENF